MAVAEKTADRVSKRTKVQADCHLQDAMFEQDSERFRRLLEKAVFCLSFKSPSPVAQTSRSSDDFFLLDGASSRNRTRLFQASDAVAAEEELETLERLRMLFYGKEWIRRSWCTSTHFKVLTDVLEKLWTMEKLDLAVKFSSARQQTPCSPAMVASLDALRKAHTTLARILGSIIESSLFWSQWWTPQRYVCFLDETGAVDAPSVRQVVMWRKSMVRGAVKALEKCFFALEPLNLSQTIPELLAALTWVREPESLNVTWFAPETVLWISETQEKGDRDVSAVGGFVQLVTDLDRSPLRSFGWPGGSEVPFSRSSGQNGSPLCALTFQRLSQELLWKLSFLFQTVKSIYGRFHCHLHFLQHTLVQLQEAVFWVQSHSDKVTEYDRAFPDRVASLLSSMAHKLVGSGTLLAGNPTYTAAVLFVNRQLCAQTSRQACCAEPIFCSSVFTPVLAFLLEKLMVSAATGSAFDGVQLCVQFRSSGWSGFWREAGRILQSPSAARRPQRPSESGVRMRSGEVPENAADEFSSFEPHLPSSSRTDLMARLFPNLEKAWKGAVRRWGLAETLSQPDADKGYLAANRCLLYLFRHELEGSNPLRNVLMHLLLLHPVGSFPDQHLSPVALHFRVVLEFLVETGDPLTADACHLRQFAEVVTDRTIQSGSFWSVQLESVPSSVVGGLSAMSVGAAVQHCIEEAFWRGRAGFFLWTFGVLMGADSDPDPDLAFAQRVPASTWNRMRQWAAEGCSEADLWMVKALGRFIGVPFELFYIESVETFCRHFWRAAVETETARGARIRAAGEFLESFCSSGGWPQEWQGNSFSPEFRILRCGSRFTWMRKLAERFGVLRCTLPIYLAQQVFADARRTIMLNGDSLDLALLCRWVVDGVVSPQTEEAEHLAAETGLLAMPGGITQRLGGLLGNTVIAHNVLDAHVAASHFDRYVRCLVQFWDRLGVVALPQELWVLVLEYLEIFETGHWVRQRYLLALLSADGDLKT
mmetsp:Transcript_3210/g.4571  ORF Transcript_3210/g.4571 Transcript_3210/m.4571 type:complete len:988 (+) Transcript_3210:98-3061(+)